MEPRIGFRFVLKVVLYLALLQSLPIQAELTETSFETGSFSAGRQLLQEPPPDNSTGLNTTQGSNATTTFNATSGVNGTGTNATVGINGTGTNATNSVNATSPETAPVALAPSPGMQLVPAPESACGGTSPCLNGGQPMLVERNNNVSCVCNCTLAVGFDGDHCETPRQICPDGFFCSNGAYCAVPASPGGAFSCHCPIGYYGPHCLDKGVVCTQTLICKNGGACNATTVGAPKCECPLGYGGADCGSDVKTPAGGGPGSLFNGGNSRKVNPVGVVFGIIGGLLVLGVIAAGGVFCWRRYRKRRSPYSFDYLYNQQSAPMTSGAFSEVQMEDFNTEQEYRNGTNIQSTSLNY